jgi:hypothetical protein
LADNTLSFLNKPHRHRVRDTISSGFVGIKHPVQ